MASFTHHDLELLNPGFSSPLVDVVTNLEHLRRLRLSGDVPYPVFLQLKTIFHMLESLGSARIEGNHTTLADYIESRLEEPPSSATDQLREMENIEEAMNYIEAQFDEGQNITEQFIKELHSIAVHELIREGDTTPGAYRTTPVSIALSDHLPPPAVAVAGYMADLVAFINRADQAKYDLMKVALAHHRFAWIHPFRNGNGRVVRLLTYSLLIKYGFKVRAGGRLLNPTAIFCNDRDRYYAMLARADSGTIEGREDWCIYVLEGMLAELDKVGRLTQATYLNDRIFHPTLRYARDRELITHSEEQILTIAARVGVVKASDLQSAMPNAKDAQRTYQIRKLVERKMLLPIHEGARQYTIGFSNSYLIRGVVRALTDEGFVPNMLSNSK